MYLFYYTISLLFHAIPMSHCLYDITSNGNGKTLHEKCFRTSICTPLVRNPHIFCKFVISSENSCFEIGLTLLQLCDKLLLTTSDG